MTIYSVILAFLSVFVTIFLPFTCAPAPENKQDDFVPVMRFVTTSDTHIYTLGDEGCRRITKMMKSAYAYSDKDSDYNSVDAVVFSGDITDDGTFTAFSAFTATTNAVLRDETTRLGVVAKAHDGGTYGTKSLEIFSSLTGQDTDFHVVIGGYHFIGISRSPSDEEHYTKEVINWLDEQLKIATEDKPDQPVFVFSHEHVLNTVFGSRSNDGWGVDYFVDVFNKYPQVMHFSGHSHYPANDPRAIWQGTFTAVNDGGLAYYEFTVDGETSVHPDGSDTMTQALIVETDKDNRVLIRVLDVDAGEIVKEFLVDNVTDEVKTKFNPDERKLLSVAPEFSDDAEISVKIKNKKLSVYFPQAEVTGDNAVYLYRIVITDENGNEVYKDKTLSEYYFASVPETQEFEGIKLSSGKYYISVHAEDVWGNESEAIFAEAVI